MSKTKDKWSKEFKFVAIHIPTGKYFDGRVECADRLEFLETMNKWNYDTSGNRLMWKYLGE